jgi:hypothetical protein
VRAVFQNFIEPAHALFRLLCDSHHFRMRGRALWHRKAGLGSNGVASVHNRQNLRE